MTVKNQWTPVENSIVAGDVVEFNGVRHVAVAPSAKETAMRRVIVESPFAGDVERNIAYARRAVRDSVLRGEAPIASHLLFTQPGILDDDVPYERQLGIDAGLAWRTVAEASVVYTDLGISRGMRYGIEAAESAGIPVEMRTIGEEDSV